MTRDIRRSDVHGSLEAAGRRAAPEPDPAFSEALELRLRAVAAPAKTAAPAPHAPPDGVAPDMTKRRRPRSLRLVLPIAAGLAVAVLLGVAALREAVPTASPSASPLELRAAVNVVVQLADGTTVQSPDSLLLPDGATVTVGDGGSARIGNLLLGPGQVVKVRDGQPLFQQPAAVSGGPTPGPSSGAEAPGRTPSTSRPSSATGSPLPTSMPTAPPTKAPIAPSATPSAAPPAPASTPAPTLVPAPWLTARLVAPGTISVRWARTPGAATYILVVTRSKSGIAAEPAYPGGRVLVQFASPPATPLRFVVAQGVVQVKVLVVAFDAEGNELARSRVVKVDVTAAAPAAPLPSPAPAAPLPSPAPSTPPAPTPTPTPSPSV